ncbi:unannotated protein [freshwater metagenome]|uniref:Unannotated protein n=1 Tax=freshwater metagenome TaxID=449393 RepID=A0A6J7E5B1_9ZZZZ|nr:hypothetical protein [Actinomycetota bacterium]
MQTNYWASHWPAEDGGAERQQIAGSILPGEATLTSKLAIASTMVVFRNPGELYLLCHTGGDDGISWVEQLDSLTLATIRRSVDMPGGLTWPGGLAVHANGSIYVVFGQHAHRLSPTLEIEAHQELPQRAPYNSFVVLRDGTLVTKNFGGARPGMDTYFEAASCELVALHPDDLRILDRYEVGQGSVARLSAHDQTTYVVGVESFMGIDFVDGAFVSTSVKQAPYRTAGEGYGWDAVIADGSAWFLNNGAGSETFDGSLLEKGIATAPQQIVRVHLDSYEVEKYEVNNASGGIVANPPAVDTNQKIVVGYDSAAGVVRAYRYAATGGTLLWQIKLNHACHPLVFPESDLVMLNDFDPLLGADQIVLVRTSTGEIVSRVATESPLQSVLFGAPGEANDLYLCSFTHVTRLQFLGNAST